VQLDLRAATLEQRHALRRMLDEALAAQIDGGATHIDIDFAPAAFEEVLRIHLWSDVQEFPTAIVVHEKPESKR
jgi:hypothetical protein